MKQIFIPCDCGDIEDAFCLSYDETDDEWYMEFKAYDVPQRFEHDTIPLGTNERSLFRILPFWAWNIYSSLCRGVLRVKGAWRALAGNPNWYVSMGVYRSANMQRMIEFINQCIKERDEKSKV